MRGISLNFKDNKTLNEVRIANTLGELIQKSKRAKTNWMKFNITSIKVQLLSLETALNYLLYVSII